MPLGPCSNAGRRICMEKSTSACDWPGPRLRAANEPAVVIGSGTVKVQPPASFITAHIALCEWQLDAGTSTACHAVRKSHCVFASVRGCLHLHLHLRRRRHRRVTCGSKRPRPCRIFPPNAATQQFCNAWRPFAARPSSTQLQLQDQNQLVAKRRRFAHHLPPQRAASAFGL